MSRTITLIPGDGIGPEVTRAVVRILAAAGFTPTWETFSAGAESARRAGALPRPGHPRPIQGGWRPVDGMASIPRRG